MVKILFKLLRILRTGFAFAMFGIGALWLSSFVFPTIILIFRDLNKKKKYIRYSISLTFKFFLYLMHYLGLIKFIPKNIETLKNDRSCLVIANHPTLIDVIAIMAHTPHACCIVKRELWDNFFIKKVVESAGYIPNDDAELLVESSKKAMASGEVLVVFPEGTRTKVGEKPVFQRGAAHIALMLKCPVRCIEISCNPITLYKNNPWYNVPDRRVDFTLEVKNLLKPMDIILPDTPRPKAARQINRLFLEQYCPNA